MGEHEPECASINVHRTCIKKYVPGETIGQWHPNLNHEVQMVAGRQSGGQTSGVRAPHQNTLVAWDEPWPHLTTEVLTVGK